MGVACLSAIGAFHAIWVPHKLAEAPYMGILFIVLSAGAVLTAVVLMVAGSRLGRAGWGLAAVVALAPLAGYVLSRVVALPQQAGLVGDWDEPLGIPSLVVEGVLVVLAAARIPARQAAMVTAALFVMAALALPAPPASAHDQEPTSGQGEQRSEGRSAGEQRSGASVRGGAQPRAGRSTQRAAVKPPPSPTPAYTVIPATAAAALLTVGGAIVLGRRGGLGPRG